MTSLLSPRVVTPAPDREIRVRDSFGVIGRHRGLVILIVSIPTLIVVLSMMLQPNFYEAKARIEIGGASQSPNTSVATGAASPEMSPAEFNSQLEYLSSPELLRKLVESLDLERDPAFLRHMTKGGRLMRRVLLLSFFGHRETNGGDSLPPSVPSNSAAALDLRAAKQAAPFVGEVARRLTVTPVLETRNVVKETHMVDIVFRHPKPLLAAKMANGLAELFVTSNLANKSASQVRMNAYLTRRAAELESSIRQEQVRLAQFDNSHQVLSLEPGQNVAVDRLTTLNRQLLDAENDRKLAEANYKTPMAPDVARVTADDKTRAVLDETTMKLADLKAKRAQMLVGATENWPEVKEVDQQILALEQVIRDIRTQAVQSATSSLENRYRQARARELDLQAAFAAQKKLVTEQNRASGEAKLIQQQIETNKEILKQLLQRLGENDPGRLESANDSRVIEYAAMPDVGDPAGPWRLPYILAAFALSLIVACASAFVTDAFDQRLRSSDDVEATFNVPPMAIIRSALATRRLSAAGASSLDPAGSSLLDESPELLLSRSCPSGFLEDYRRLRTMLLFSMRSQPRTVLVTSSVAGEGSTTTAVNIAVSLAQMGIKVLLIDANMRSPKIHQIFDVENSVGLSSLLSSGASESDILGAIHHDAGTDVHILPSGPTSLNSAELLGSGRMRSLLRRVESSYSHIVLDTPAINSRSDSIILASICGAVLLVVQASKTSRELVRQSQASLASMGARLLGLVLNNVSIPEAEQYDIPVSSYTPDGDVSGNGNRATNGNGSGNGSGWGNGNDSGNGNGLGNGSGNGKAKIVASEAPVRTR